MCLTVGQQSRDHRPLSRDPSVSFYKKFPRGLKRRKTLFDSQPTVAWPPTTVPWPFSDFFQNFPKSLETSKKRFFDSQPTVAWPQPLSRDRSATFSKFSQIAWNVQKTFFDSQPTVAWPPTTVAWPFCDFFQNFPKSLETSKKRCLTVGRRSRDHRPLSRDRSADFFQNFPKSLETSKKRCLTVGRRSRDLNHCRVTVQRLYLKFSQIAWNVQKTLFDSRPTVAWPPTTVAWPFSGLFSKFSQIAWNVEKTLFDSRPTVAWPPTTLAWPFSDFFQKHF